MSPPPKPLPSSPTWYPSARRWFVVASLAALVPGATLAASARFLPRGALVPGLTIDGAAPPGALFAPADAHGDEGGAGADAVRAFVAERAAALTGRQVVVALGGEELFRATLGDLGVVVDVDRVAARAMSVGHDGDVLARVDAARRARRGELDVPLAPRVDPGVAVPILLRVKEARDLAPISARLDIEHRTTVEGRAGRYVDVDAAIAAALRLASGAGAPAGGGAPLRLDLPVIASAPRMTAEYVSSLDVRAVLSEYDTFFSRSGDQSRRGQNIDVAAGKLDGLVLSPSELVSFNQVVGERSEGNGFQRSWEIYKGEMVEGIGGGTCQVASTLNAIAFFGGLEILERLPHSRPSAYIPMGLDATVVYPVVDMKLRNPYPFPVVVHTRVEGNRLHMELRGASKPVSVKFERELVKMVAYGRKIEEKAGLSAKRVVLRQHGIRGFRVKRTRTLFFRDGHKRVETNKDFYPPTAEIYEVPPGFDPSLLPPLPADDVDEDADQGDAADAPPAAPIAVAPSPAGSGPASTLALDTSNPFDPPRPVEAPRPDVIVVVGAGAHAPTTAQAKPPRTVSIRR